MNRNQAPMSVPHGPVTIALHWTAAALVVAAFSMGLAMEELPRGEARNFAMMLHYSLGTLVLGSVLLRLLHRLLLRPASQAETGPAARLAGLTHWALYGLMLGIPMTGALDRWARGRPLSIFGGFVVPAPFPIPASKVWEDIHVALAWTLMGLVAAHVAAALWHHLVLRDSVLLRMLPGRMSKRLDPSPQISAT
jgi:cytochrome b561